MVHTLKHAALSILNWLRSQNALASENARLRTQLQRTKREHNKAIKRLKAEHERDVERLEASRRSQIDAIQANHAERVDALEIALKAAIDSLDAISATKSYEALAFREQIREKHNGALSRR